VLAVARVSMRESRRSYPGRVATCLAGKPLGYATRSTKARRALDAAEGRVERAQAVEQILGQRFQGHSTQGSCPPFADALTAPFAELRRCARLAALLWCPGIAVSTTRQIVNEASEFGRTQRPHVVPRTTV
jgi:hypothetical protein